MSAAVDITIGGWCHFDSAYTAELMGSAGFDWCCVDMQHGLPDRAALVPMLQALQLTGCYGLVRVPSNQHEVISHALDSGARGVIVPQVSTAAQAELAVRACRYPPTGNRSWGPLRAKLAPVRPEPATLDSVAECFVMVEDREGLDHVEEIAAVEGLTGIFVGPADLALSLWGDPYLANAEETLESARAVANACRAAAITAAVFAGGSDQAVGWRNLGFTMLALNSDSAMLTAASKSLVRSALKELGRPER